MKIKGRCEIIKENKLELWWRDIRFIVFNERLYGIRDGDKRERR